MSITFEFAMNRDELIEHLIDEIQQAKAEVLRTRANAEAEIRQVKADARQSNVDVWADTRLQLDAERQIRTQLIEEVKDRAEERHQETIRELADIKNWLVCKFRTSPKSSGRPQHAHEFAVPANYKQRVVYDGLSDIPILQEYFRQDLTSENKRKPSDDLDASVSDKKIRYIHP